MDQSDQNLWLLPDEPVRQEVADVVYRVGWHSHNNERDDDYLRDIYRNAGHNRHTFLTHLADTKIGRSIHDEWQQWAGLCQCTWEHPDGPVEYFPTHRNHPSIRERCSLHQMVRACSDYCQLIDQDWYRLQDWYSIGERPKTGDTGEDLIRDYPPTRVPSD